MFQNMFDGQIFLKFLFLGVIFGLFFEICKIIKIISKNNIFITNTINFIYFCTFGTYFCSFLLKFAGGTLYIYTILASVFGFVLEQISIGFFFTNLYKLLYNVFTKLMSRAKSTKFGSKILR